MANIPFKSITFPGLPNKYTVPEISNDLMTAGKAADAKATGDALSALEDQFSEETDQLKADLGDLSELETETKTDLVSAINEAASSGRGGLTAEIKQALLQLATKVAYIDADGQDYYDDLYDALYPNAQSISCVYTQGGTVYETDSLDGLKDNLVVTAHYSDSTMKTLANSDYTLTGTLTAGTSTIAVHYGNLVATFTVTVTTRTLSGISAAYTQTEEVYTDDILDDLKNNLVVTAHYSDSSTEVVQPADYTLSGTLAAGTSTITVIYNGKTTTFNVTITAPLYSIPDFAEQTVTSSSKSAKIKKENGYYTASGNFGGSIYVSPNGTASATRPTTEWFSTTEGKALRSEIFDVTWENATSQARTLTTKFSRSDADSNIYSAEMSMPANSSGAGDDGAAYTSDALASSRSLSAFVVQLAASGSPTGSVSATFKVRLFCDGVRYL